MTNKNTKNTTVVTTTTNSNKPGVTTTTSSTSSSTRRTPKRAPRPAPKPKVHNSYLGAALVLLAIIIILLAAFWFLSNNGQQNVASLPQFQNSNMAVPSAFSGVTTQSSQQTTLNLASLAQTHLSQLMQFSIAYGGSIYFRPTGVVGSLTKINSPLNVNESRYNKELKLNIYASSIPVLGTGTVTYLSLANGTFVCTNFNTSAASTNNYGALMTGSRSISCARSNELAGINLDQVARFNLSALESNGMQLTYQTVYQSTYAGVPCTFIAGTISDQSPNGGNLGNGAFEMCVSDTYYVPVSFSLYFIGTNATVSALLNETSIGNYSQQSYIETLPAPVS